MEEILALAKALKDLKSKNAAKIAPEVSLIHAASTFWICKVAHKIRTNRFLGGDCEKKLAQEVEVPIQEKWDLKLGDEVRIKYKLPEFKAIQKKTIGWRKKYRQAISPYGFISNICNEYDPHVMVSFPEIDMECEIYAGVLEKLPSSHGENENLHFRPGDVVSIHSSKKVADLLQRGYDNLPDSFLTKKGQVIAVRSDQVFVTFEGTVGRKMNPALLKLESGSKKLVFKQATEDAGKFKVGDKVKVIPNLKKVIEQQKGHGGWDKKMIKMVKGDVTVLLLKKGNNLRVCDQTGQSWSFNAESLVLKDETPKEDQDEDVPYKIGDKIRVKHVPNFRQILEQEEIPLTILQFLQLPAEVLTYDDDLEAGISYNSTTNIIVNSLLLEKVSDANIQDTKKALKNLKQGDKVHLNVGPPNYVRDVLKETSASDKVITALTTSAVIHGFKGPNHVIIKYSDGERYKIHKKYITLPSTYHIRFQDKESKFKWENVPEVTSVLKNCLNAIHDDFQGSGVLQLDHGVDSISLVHGQPTILDVKIKSPIATYENLLNTLRQMSGWEIKEICEGMILVKELPGCKSEIQMKFSINEDEKQVMKYVKSESIEEPTRKIVGGFGNEQQLEAEREPPGYQPPGYLAPQEYQCDVNLRRNLAQEYNPRAASQRNLREGDLGSGIPTSYNGFRLMQLSDESIGRTVLFPYLLFGEDRRQPTSNMNMRSTEGGRINIFQT